MTSGVYTRDEQVANGGFTSWVRITWADLVATAALTKTQQILPNAGSSTGLPIGFQVRKVAALVETAFAGCATLVVEVGDDGDVDRNLVSYDCKSAAGTWKNSVPSTSPSIFNAANALDAKFTATTDNLSSLSAGSLFLMIAAEDLSRHVPAT